MDRRKLSLVLITIVLVSVFHFALTVLPESVRATTLYVGSGPGNYTTIQAALDDAQPGDTIYIYSGTYGEELTITQTVSLVGEDRETTSISGSTRNGTVRVEADWVNISELSISGFGMSFETGLVLSSAHNCTIYDNDINGETGFVITDSNNTRIINNSINGYYGALGIGSAHNSYFLNNSVYGMISYGVMMSNTNNTIFISNEICNSSSGFGVHNSNNLTITSNRMTNNSRLGLSIDSSSYLTVTHNTMLGSGIYMEGNLLEHWNTHIIEPSNTIDGEPVIYWKNATGGTILADAGEVILANCTGVEVRDQTVSRGDVGIVLGFSHENIIADNNASMFRWNTPHGSIGLMLEHSENNTMTGNEAVGRPYGIYLLYSANNSISGNNASDNFFGIHLEGSSGNRITNNSITNSSSGIRLESSPNNAIFHNNFIDNNDQAVEQDGLNQWDDGYPSGGNYWSDYPGQDTKSGPNQDLPGPDGIGDTAYVINVDSKDKYPLMNPVPFTAPSPPSSPRNLQATPGNQQVTLTWEAPASEGGSPVTNYVVYRGNLSGGEVFLVMVGNVLSYIDAGLVNGQTYYYQVSAVNADGEGPKSNEASATPFSPPNQLPICTVTAPTAGETVSNTYAITGTASDPDGTVVMVEINIDGGSWVQATGTTSWNYDWNTTTVSDDQHTIYARSNDGSNYSTEVSVTVTVNNTQPPEPERPLCAITSPTSGSTISGAMEVSGTASDPDGTVQTVEIRIDSGTWIEVTGTTTWSYYWNTTSVSDGEHTIYARSYDGTLYSTEVNVSVSVDNVPPEEGEEPEKGLLWVWGIMAIVILAIVFLSIYFLTKKQKEEGEPPEEPL